MRGKDMEHMDNLQILKEKLDILQQIFDTLKGTIEAQERTMNSYETMRDLNDIIYQQQSDAWFGVFDTLIHVGIGDFTEKGLQGIDDWNYSLVSECIDIAWSKHSKLENLIANLKGKPDVY